MTRSTEEKPGAWRARYMAEINALPPEQAERLHELRGIVEAAREAARLAMVAYVRAEMEAHGLSPEARADLESFYFGVPGDPTQDSVFGVRMPWQAEIDFYLAHDRVRYAATRGRIGEAA